MKNLRSTPRWACAVMLAGLLSFPSLNLAQSQPSTKPDSAPAQYDDGVIDQSHLTPEDWESLRAAEPIRELYQQQHSGVRQGQRGTTHPSIQDRPLEAYKTSEELDTFNNHAIRCPENWDWSDFAETEDFSGFFSGTLNGDVILGNQDTAAILGHGLTVNNVGSRIRRPILHGLEIWYAPGTRVVEEIDTFDIEIWEITRDREDPLRITRGQREQIQPFVWGNLRIWDDVTDLSEPVFVQLDERADPDTLLLPRREYLIMVSTKRLNIQNNMVNITGDDYQNFEFFGPNDICDPDNENDWFVRVWNVTQRGGFIAAYNDFFGATEDVPHFIPIFNYDPEDTVVQVSNEPLVKSQGISYYGNYPNPAVDFTHIRYAVDNNTTSRLVVRDMQGRVVHQTEWEPVAAGEHDHYLNTSQFSCGTYIYRIETTRGAIGGKLVIEK